LRWDSTAESKLAIAAQDGNLREIHEFFSARISIKNKPRYFTVRAIHNACEYGRLKALRALLEYEPDRSILEKVDRYYESPLHHTIGQYSKKNRECLNFLLNSGVDVESRDSSLHRTPLIAMVAAYSSRKDRLQGMQLLLQHVSSLHKGKVRQIMFNLSVQIPDDLISIVNSYLSPYECPDYVNMSERSGKTALFYVGFVNVGRDPIAEERAASIAATRLLLEAGASPLATGTSSILTDPLDHNSEHRLTKETPVQYIQRGCSTDPANEAIAILLDEPTLEWWQTERQAFYEARWAKTANGYPDQRYYAPAPPLPEND
jgi:hypothetical protein